MPRMGGSAVSVRLEFVKLARAEGANVRELCRRFRISAPTGYKWLRRFEQAGIKGLEDGSHRPHRQPRCSSAELEQRVVALRKLHPAWGGRKLRAVLQRAGQQPVPSASTVTAILRRHQLLDLPPSGYPIAWRRFEYGGPNELWQMDIKGHFALDRGRCYPLTVLDDYSRFSLGVQACRDQREPTVRERLTAMFRKYGLPVRMLADNGAPFGTAGNEAFSTLELWLMRLGVKLYHGRPRHPQTQGKDERFHRTLNVELLRGREFATLAHAQREFDRWREVYNFQRPHQALAMQVPGDRYQASPRSFPEALPRIEYAPDLTVCTVNRDAAISFQRRRFKIGKAFIGLPVALRPTTTDGSYQVFFCNTQIRSIDLQLRLNNV